MSERIRAVVFDAYGTLLDVHGAMQGLADRLPPDWEAISAEWRTKQMEYTWVRTLTGHGRHVDFWRITKDSLAFIAEKHRIKDQEVLAGLLSAYRRLPAFPDAEPALRSLRTQGLRLAILSNGEPGMLQEAVEAAGVAPLLDMVLSVEAVGQFKPAPSVYEMAGSALGLPLDQIGFVSSNAWDAQAAAANGFRVFWCNRKGGPEEYGLGQSATVIGTLGDLPASLG